MIDREKVIKGLEEISDYFFDIYRNDTDSYKCEKAQEYSDVAIDAIALLKEQETMRWISVTDRLPTYAELKTDCVLALFDDGTICSTGFDECIEDESIFGEWRENFDPVTHGAINSYWMPLEDITHWMPIPKLMQEGR